MESFGERYYKSWVKKMVRPDKITNVVKLSGKYDILTAQEK